MHLLADEVHVVPGRVQRRMCEHIGHDLDPISGTDERCCRRCAEGHAALRACRSLQAFAYLAMRSSTAREERRPPRSLKNKAG
jgi:hypothetical protein